MGLNIIFPVVIIYKKSAILADGGRTVSVKPQSESSVNKIYTNYK